MLEVFSSDYIRTARAKGAGRGVVIWRHALRNALIPYLTVGGVEFSLLFGGVVIIENIFLLPGIGWSRWTIGSCPTGPILTGSWPPAETPGGRGREAPITMARGARPCSGRWR